MKCCAALMCSAAIADAAATDSRIVPALRPRSDKEFMSRDYPDDGRPHAVTNHKQFEYPYPAVQKSRDFDADFVKDENSDGGQWQAQMKYDMSRAKVRRAKQELQQAEDMTGSEKKAYDAAFDRATAAGHSAEEAHKRAIEAAEKYAATHAEQVALEKDAMDKRKTAIADLAAADAVKQSAKAVDAAKMELAKEEHQFKICTEQLEKAKADLKKAEEEAAAAEEASKAANEKKKGDLTKEASKDSDEATTTHTKKEKAAVGEKNADAEVKKLEQDQHKEEQMIAKEKKKQELEEMSVTEAQIYVDKVGKELAAAEARLKCFRKHGSPCPKTTPAPKEGWLHSGAFANSGKLLIFGLVFALAAVNQN